MLPKFIASQFQKPTGLLGIAASNLMRRSNYRKYDRLIKGLNLQPHSKLLEIGYGPGVGIGMVAKMCPTCTIHGIDFSALMYKRARILNQQYIDDGRVHLQYGDFLEASDMNNDYVIIFCVNVVHFWKELNGPFRKVWSLLNQKGAFHMYLLDEDALANRKLPVTVVYRHSIGQVAEALKTIGFTDIKHYSEQGLYVTGKK